MIKVNKKLKNYIDFIGDAMLMDETFDDLLFVKLRNAKHWMDQKGVV